MSGVKGMGRNYADEIIKYADEINNGNQVMINHRGKLYAETSVNALYLAVKWFKRDPVPLDATSKSNIRTWLRKRRASK